MNNTVAIVFSTITGNAFKLSEAVSKVVSDHVGPYNIRYINDEVIEKFDTFILSYWCDKGSADPDTLELIGKLHNKNLILVGSLGVSRETKHYSDVLERVSAVASEHNNLLGHFLCQGAIDLARTGAKLRAGKITKEHFEKQKASQGHPDAQDLTDAQNAVKGFLTKL